MYEFEPGELVPEAVARRYLHACGSGVKIYRGCRLTPPDRIRIGDYSQVDEGVRIFAGDGVEVGAHVHIAFGASILGGGECVIGDFCGIGAGVRIVTGTELIDSGELTNPTIPPTFRAVKRCRVVIGKHALIFTNSIILPSVTIGEGAVVSAGGIVHRDLRPWTVYAGNPLVAVKARVRCDGRVDELKEMEERFGVTR